MRIRAWAEVTDHFTIVDPRCVDALSPFYVWTPDYAEKRLGWRGRQPLHVLLLRTYRIPRPVTVKVKDEYTGPGAWLELQRELPFEGTPVLSDAEFERASEEIRAITSEAAPAGPSSPVLGYAVSSKASASRAACAAGLGDEHVARTRRPGSRARPTPPERRSMLGMPSSSSSPAMNSASGWFSARATFTSAPSVYCGLILRARRWRSLAAGARRRRACTSGIAAVLAEALARADARARSVGHTSGSLVHHAHLERDLPRPRRPRSGSSGPPARSPASPTITHSRPGQLAAKLMSVCDG